MNSAQANVAASQAQLSTSVTQRNRAVIRSPVSGVVRELRGKEGDKVAVGAPLVVIEVSSDAPARSHTQSRLSPRPIACSNPARTSLRFARSRIRHRLHPPDSKFRWSATDAQWIFNVPMFFSITTR